MTTVTIGDQSATYVADQTDTTYLLEAGTKIKTSSSWGIQANTTVANRTFLINGEIDADVVGIVIGGIGQYADGTTLVIGETGHVHTSGSGISANTNNSTYQVLGSVEGVGSIGFYVHGDGNRFSNSGNIHGGTGLQVSGDDNVCNNAGTITGGEYGVLIDSSVGDTTRLVNSGWISGGDYAIKAGQGDETVVNSGKIFGNVSLNIGNDIFVSKGGIVTGFVNGGFNDDRYIVDSAAINLVEDAESGNDTVKSSVSWTLGDNFEQAFLTGKKNINLTGNDAGSTLTGNGGGNKIVGMLGDDVITGGRGNDVMTGDNGQVAFAGSDTFVFKHHSGQDVIADFHNGEDLFDLTGYDGLEGFADLKGHIKQVGDDVVVTLLDGDQFTLQDAHKADLNASDFVF